MRLTFIILLALLSSTVFADVVMEVHLAISKDDSVVVKQFRTVLGKPDAAAVFVSDYRVVVREGNLTKFSTFIPVDFPHVEPLSQEFVIPKSEFETASVSLKLPYFGNLGEVVLFKSDKRLLTLPLPDLCNGNDVCDATENFLSCDDCPLKATDSYCYPASDKVCDPDCAKSVDPDCFVPTPVKKRFFAILIVVLIMAVVLGVVWYLIERAKHL